jgi:quercetin dioxygenase-like cupin family protein
LGVDPQHDVVEGVSTAEGAGYASLWTSDGCYSRRRPLNNFLRASDGNLPSALLAHLRECAAARRPFGPRQTNNPRCRRPRRSASIIGSRTALALVTATVAAVIIGCSGPAPKSPADPVEAHPAEILTPVLTEELLNAPGKTFTSAIVTFQPGARAVAHRHGDAFVYAYVLEGAVNSQLEGQPAHVYHQGENWTEEPGAHHLTTENASQTDEAKLLVVFIATTGAQLKIDDTHG